MNYLHSSVTWEHLQWVAIMFAILKRKEGESFLEDQYLCFIEHLLYATLSARCCAYYPIWFSRCRFCRDILSEPFYTPRHWGSEKLSRGNLARKQPCQSWHSKPLSTIAPKRLPKIRCIRQQNVCVWDLRRIASFSPQNRRRRCPVKFEFQINNEKLFSINMS